MMNYMTEYNARILANKLLYIIEYTSYFIYPFFRLN